MKAKLLLNVQCSQLRVAKRVIARLSKTTDEAKFATEILDIANKSARDERLRLRVLKVAQVELVPELGFYRSTDRIYCNFIAIRENGWKDIIKT